MSQFLKSLSGCPLANNDFWDNRLLLRDDRARRSFAFLGKPLQVMQFPLQSFPSSSHFSLVGTDLVALYFFSVFAIIDNGYFGFMAVADIYPPSSSCHQSLIAL